MNLYDIVKITAAKLADKSVSNTKFRDSVGLSVVGRNTNSDGDVGDIVANTDKRVLRRNGNAIGFGQIEGEAILNGEITPQKLSGAQTGVAPAYAIRAYVNFEGTGSVGSNQTLNNDGNIQSVLKNGTGDYTITFDLGIAGDYVCFGGTSDSPTGGTVNFAAKTLTTLQVKTYNSSGLATDFSKVYVSVIS
jgi:hypothetical protein